MRVARSVMLAGVAVAGVAALAGALWVAGLLQSRSSPPAVANPIAQAGASSPVSSLGAGLGRYVVVPEESRALYRVGEPFLRFNRPNVAVGVTQAISGEILVDRQQPARTRLGVFTVDISQLRSDEPRQDQTFRERWLESARFPMARFQAVSIEGLPDALREEERVSVTVHGELTIRDVTRPVTFEASFEVAGDTLGGTARTNIRMTDFGFQPPSVLGVLRADNEVQIEVDLVARRSE